jgi:hypothetical protein
MDQPELAAPAEARHSRAAQPLAESFGKGTPKISAAKLDTLDAAAQQDLFQPADGGFDFRKFWHGRDMAERP